jgi:hypothetical protein
LCSIEKDFSEFFAAAKEGAEKAVHQERHTSAAKAAWQKGAVAARLKPCP